MSDNAKNYYQVLGIASSAGRDEIRAVYRRLAFELHPDRNSSADAQTRFQEIIEAFTVLSDPRKRAEYDALLLPEKPIIVSESLTTSPGFNVAAAYDQLAQNLPQHFSLTGREEYLAHLHKVERRRNVARTIIAIILILLLLVFGFKPLANSSGAVSASGNSQSSSAGSVVTTPGLNQSLLIMKGLAGAEGKAGPAGARGRDGRIGIDGSPGPAGANGRDGAPGAAGPAGANGKDGLSGAPGAPGAAGPAGPPGIAGAKGETGTAGTGGAVYTVRPNIGVGNGDVQTCTDQIDSNSVTTSTSLDVSLGVYYNPGSGAYPEGYYLSKINLSNIPRGCMGDTIQINVKLSTTPQTPFATNAGAHFSCIMTNPLSEAANFHNGNFASYSFVSATPSSSECRTDPFLGGTHSGFNNPSGGAPNWDDQPLDIGLIYGTDLFHVSLVISS